MLKMDKEFLESLVSKETCSHEVSLRSIVEFKQYQYQNIVKYVNELRKKMEDKFTDIRIATFEIDNPTSKIHFYICEDKTTNIEHNYVTLFNILEFSLPKRISSNEFHDFAMENEKLFGDLINEIRDKEISVSHNLYLPDVNNKYCLKIIDNSVTVIYNSSNIDIQNYNLDVFHMQFNGIFTMGIDFLFPPKKQISNSLQDYYFWSNNKLREFYYRKYLNLGMYNNQIINPFDAIKFDEDCMPKTMNKKINSLILK